MRRHDWISCLTLCLSTSLGSAAQAAQAAPTGVPAAASRADDAVLQAREALKRRDKAVLAASRMAVITARHPLASWVEYWELQNRLGEAQQAELDTFWTRWPGSYVEDRLRNDWLLELGRRRDWVNFRAEFPRFRMNDDLEVSCYALLAQHLDGQDVRSAARTAWWAQRDLDDGCALMARTLFEARQLTPEDAWQEARLSVEANRPRAARAAVNLVDPHLDNTVATVLDDPIRYLTRRGAGEGRHGHELLLLALMRAAANDPDTVAGRLEDPLIHRLPLALSATAWAHVAKQAALKLLPTADDYARRAWKQWDAAHKPGTQPPWSGDLLAWHVRAALRQPAAESSRWTLMLRAVEAMSPAQQQDAAWVYWKARATLALAAPGAEGDAARAGSHAQMEALATHQGFYAKLAAEDIDGRSALPLAPAAPTVEERDVVRALPGLARALQLIGLGLRSEGTREWNFSLRGLGERELLAAAQLACERQVWDRCIGTSERMRQGFDAAQRFPMPFRESLLARAREAGIEPAVLFGLIRQESRFVADARSAVGASGLMQLMPATARGVAKKLGVGGVPDSITDPSLNLQLGAAYLKRVLDEFGGSLTMAAAAYNAGPGRPRRWREGTQAMEPAAWAESIPFNETRDYVKKVLSNSVDYAELLGVPGVTLKSRLGPAIGPREPGSATPDRTLP